jgi:hypothetical protein
LRWYDSMNIIIFDNPHKTHARSGCPSPPPPGTPPPAQAKLSPSHSAWGHGGKERAHTVFRAASRLQIHSRMAEAQRAQNTHGKNKKHRNSIKIILGGWGVGGCRRAGLVPSPAATRPASRPSAAHSTPSAAACGWWSCPTAQQAASGGTRSAQPSAGTRACR